MAIGPGYLDPQGVWRYGEDDLETLASDMLDLGQESVSQQFALVRVRLDVIEGATSGVIAPPPNFTVNATSALNKDHNGFVTLNLFVSRTSGTISVNEQMATLPAGFRPNVTDSIAGGGFGSGGGGVGAASLRVYATGAVLYIGPANMTVFMGSVTFKAAT